MLFFFKEDRVLLPWRKPGRWEEKGIRIQLSTYSHPIIRNKVDKILISAINPSYINTSFLATLTGAALALTWDVMDYYLQEGFAALVSHKWVNMKRKCLRLLLIEKKNRELRLMTPQYYSLPVTEDFRSTDRLMIWNTHTHTKVKWAFSRILGQFLEEIL